MFPLSSTKCSERGMDFWEGVLPLTAFNPERQSQFPTYPGTHACFPLVECVGGTQQMGVSTVEVRL